MKKEVVLIFQKNEVLGKVKTRLAAGMGEHRALEIYRYLIRLTYSALETVQVPVWTYFSDFIPQTVNVPVDRSFVQQGQDLGERMANAFARTFESGMNKGVLIGTDCPTLQPQHLVQAFDALTNSDLVLGPATDGGYYLIGMKHLHSNLFEGITWSTSTVLAETLKRAKIAGLSVYLLPQLDDVDTAADWEKYVAKHPEVGYL